VALWRDRIFHRDGRDSGDGTRNLPEVLVDKGYDADWFRDDLAQRKITVFIPSCANRKVPIPYDPALYKKWQKIENMFGRL
jgi:transposase